MKKIRAAITGVGGYVPDYILSNKELESMVDTTNDWIVSRTGIRERRILKEENKGVSYMACKAVNEMLEKTGVSALDIDLIIFATITPDMPFPAAANLVANEIGAKNSFSFDIGAACSGFLYALTTAAQFIESGKLKRVIVIGGDKMSSITDYQDRTTCIIFGDGVGCVMLESSEEYGIIDSLLKSDGSGMPYLHMKAGGSQMPASHQSVEARFHYVYQEGAPVFRAAVSSMSDVIIKIIERNNLTPENITWVAPHQANQRIMNATAEKVKIAPEKMLSNIQRYGNTTSGTIPLLLWDYEKKLNQGDTIVIAAFGGGFTWGSVLLTWAYNTH